jgi:hypothetical protein
MLWRSERWGFPRFAISRYAAADVSAESEGRLNPVRGSTGEVIRVKKSVNRGAAATKQSKPSSLLEQAVASIPEHREQLENYVFQVVTHGKGRGLLTFLLSR